MEAKYYNKLEKGVVECTLCPRNCKIDKGKIGYCNVRQNVDGKLISLVYGKVAAMYIDPIEKKPLFHFYPGEKVFSFGTVGCNLRCKFCQNWEISHPEKIEGEDFSPKEIVDLAIKNGCKIIAATYNEPTIFFEFMVDVFTLAKKKGLKTVVVSNGFINQGPLKEVIKITDAFNIDLKSFENKFYTTLTTTWIKPVLEIIKTINLSKSHLEITNLIIPTKNDDEENIREMCSWVVENVGLDVPLHFSAFFPMFKLNDVPPTTKEQLDNAYNIAKSFGINYIYEGNLPGEENTYCPKCGEVIIERKRYRIIKNKIKKDKCPYCSFDIVGRFR